MAMALAQRVPVGSRKLPQPINLSQSYPCPCCHQGRLREITLTEAFGCERCQYIFALTDDHLHIENLAAAFPYRKLWFWNGAQWVLYREGTESGSLLIRLLVVALVFLILLFLLVAHWIESVYFPPGIIIFVVVLGAGVGIALLSCRR